MKQWEIWDFPVPSKEEPHGFVILSPTSLVQNSGAKFVNGVMCTSLRGGAELRDFEVALNGADGLDAKTRVNCSLIYALAKADAKRKRGEVSPDRRKQIVKRIYSTFKFNDVL